MLLYFLFIIYLLPNKSSMFRSALSTNFIKTKIKIMHRCMNNNVVDSLVDYSYHTPVMLKECCDNLNVTNGSIFIDCTMGGGGHSRAIISRGGRVVGIDQDPDAVKKASELLRSHIEDNKFEIIQSNFRHIQEVIKSSKFLNGNLADGILMDLGISSYQINESTRGFAFGSNGPLDMRMSKESGGKLTASTIVNEWDVTRIADVLYQYGDEVRSRQIAREIVAKGNF